MPRPPKTYASTFFWMNQHWKGGRDDGPTHTSLAWDLASGAQHTYMCWTEGDYNLNNALGFWPNNSPYLIVQLDGELSEEGWYARTAGN